MLSYSGTLILGIIAEKSLNPYEIKKLLDKISIKKWLPIAASSVYATIRLLEKKGLISGETARDGNMPEKTIFTITDSGKTVLHESIIAFMNDMESDTKKFNISCLFICHLDKEHAIGILKGKRMGLEKKSAFIKNMTRNMRSTNAIPYTGLQVIKLGLDIVEAEISAVDELVANIRTDEEWDHFITKDLLKKNNIRES